ncbi:MAG: hypothetical protein K2W95_18365 [Candidatus Obscuribacterales bacterium]|nr:hypothetical protein [Candidatus Obscuribacterales bacterium]
MFDSPPEIIPENLAAQEYLYLGQWYKEKHDYDQARSALQRAIETAPGSTVASEAKHYMAQNIPVCSVPKRIMERYDKLLVNMVINSRIILDECRALTLECPDFDWAHCILGDALLQNAKVLEAISALKKAQALNPERITTMISLAEAHIIVMDYESAQAYVRKISTLLPGRREAEATAQNTRERFEQVSRSLQILMAIG